MSADHVLGPMFMTARDLVNSYRLGDAKSPKQTIESKESLLAMKASSAEGPSRENWPGASRGVAASIRENGYDWDRRPVVISHDSPHGAALMNGHHRVAYMYFNHPDEHIPVKHYTREVAPSEREAMDRNEAARFRQVLDTHGDRELYTKGFPGWLGKKHLAAAHEQWNAETGRGTV
jgi:hypothetical protein